MKITKDTKFLIVGLGLIGGSYGARLSKLGYQVGAIDINENSIKYALDNGIITSGMSDGYEDYISKADIVISGLYPKAFLDWINKYQKCLKENVLITDVTGVKTSIVYDIQEALREDLEFIGAHPMAGKETSGVENASATLFFGANYIVTPTEKNTEEAIEICKDLGVILGAGNISVLSPKEHDEMIAFLSQLTHCIAVSLMTCKDSKHLVDYTGDSFRDLTRIARINDKMWSELFMMNKDELLAQMDLFIDRFSELKATIENGEVDKMREIMRLSTERRSYFDKPSK